MAADPKEVFKEYYEKGVEMTDSPAVKPGSFLDEPINAALAPRTSTNAEYVTNAVKKYWGGLWGFPVDVVNSLLDLPSMMTDLVPRGGTDYPLMGSANLQEGLGYDPNLQPTGPGQRVAGEVAGNVVASAPFAMHSAVKSTAGAGIDLLAGAGAGVGGAIAQEAKPGNTGLEMAGQMTGGLGVGLTASRLNAIREVSRSSGLGLNAFSKERAKDLWDRLTNFRTRTAENFVDAKFAGSVEGADQARLTHNIEESFRLEDKFPGLKFSLDQRTGVPSIRSIARDVAMRDMVSLNERFNLDMVNRELLKAQGLKRIPRGNVNIDQGIGQARMKLQSQMDLLDDQMRSLDTEFDNTVHAFAREEPSSVGATLRQIRADEKKAAKEINARLFGNVDALSSKYKARVNGEGILETAAEMVNDPVFKMDPATVPTVIGRIEAMGQKYKWNKDRFGKFTGGKTNTLDFQEVRALREAVGNDIADELSSLRPNRRRLRNLFGLRNSIDDSMDQLANTNHADLNEAYQNAVAHYRDKYVPRFERGVNLKLGMINSLGDPRIPDEKVINSYFTPGGSTPIKRFKELFAEHPVAMGAFQKGVVDKFYREVINPRNGNFDQAAYSRFMSKYAAPLKELPNLEQAFGDLGVTVRMLSQRRTELFQQTRDLNNSVLAKVLKHDDPEGVLKSAMKDPVSMAVLVESMPPNSRQAVVTSIMDRAFQESTMKTGEFDALDPVKFKEFLTKNESSLKTLLSKTYRPEVAKQFMADLNDLQKGLEMIERSPITVKTTEALPGITVDPLKAQTGISSQSVFAASRAVGGGRGSPQYFAGVFGGQLLNFLAQKQIGELTRKALYDPETARLMVKSMKAPDLTADLKDGLKSALSKMGYIMLGTENIAAKMIQRMPVLGLSGRGQQPTPIPAEEEEPLGLDLGQ